MSAKEKASAFLMKRARWFVSLAAVALPLISWAAAAAETRYSIDPLQSEMTVQLFRAGAGAVLAHDHVVRATTYAGHLRFDPAAPHNSAVMIEVQTASLTIDEPTTRQKYGLSSQLSEKDRLSIEETMRSASQLDVAHYPTIQFSSKKVEAQRGGTYTVTGNLTIRGITQSVKILAQVEQRDNELHVHGSFRFKQSDFGYTPYSAFFGAVRNQDEVLLHFDLLAVP